VTPVSDSGASAAAAVATAAPDAVIEVDAAIDATDRVAATAATGAAVTRSKWYRLRRDGAALVNYLLDSEVHTYAFSVAANAILSFIPFIVLLYTIALSVLHSTAMADVVSDMIHYFFPSNQDWIAKNLVLETPRRATVLAGHDPDFVHGHLPAFGGGTQPGVGSGQEPQLSAQPGGGFRAGDTHGGPGHDQHRAQRRAAPDPGVPLFSSHR